MRRSCNACSNQVPGDDAIRDGYWTLIGYFNSLGSCRRPNCRSTPTWTSGSRNLAVATRCHHARSTSWRSSPVASESSKIPQYLKQIFVKYPNKNAIDVLLATNMISVGVDVDRLGLMVVTGSRRRRPSTSRPPAEWVDGIPA